MNICEFSCLKSKFLLPGRVIFENKKDTLSSIEIDIYTKKELVLTNNPFGKMVIFKANITDEDIVKAAEEIRMRVLHYLEDGRSISVLRF